MELVVVRHGETEWTISGQYTGCTEMTLTSNGRRQAASLRRILNSVLRTRTPVAYSSPRERAPETARLALPDARARIDSALSEFDHGSYEGLTRPRSPTCVRQADRRRSGCSDRDPTPRSRHEITRCRPRAPGRPSPCHDGLVRRRSLEVQTCTGTAHFGHAMRISAFCGICAARTLGRQLSASRVRRARRSEASRITRGEASLRWNSFEVRVRGWSAHRGPWSASPAAEE